mmetsp:Transcript_8076/g.17477  ORF Transcript_8076/g.17477 Transcript_8076/m.17477 type:complete len:278 (+) Transcript_8076:953-1786(+)
MFTGRYRMVAHAHAVLANAWGAKSDRASRCSISAVSAASRLAWSSVFTRTVARAHIPLANPWELNVVSLASTRERSSFHSRCSRRAQQAWSISLLVHRATRCSAVARLTSFICALCCPTKRRIAAAESAAQICWLCLRYMSAAKRFSFGFRVALRLARLGAGAAVGTCCTTTLRSTLRSTTLRTTGFLSSSLSVSSCSIAFSFAATRRLALDWERWLLSQEKNRAPAKKVRTRRTSYRRPPITSAASMPAVVTVVFIIVVILFAKKRAISADKTRFL